MSYRFQPLERGACFLHAASYNKDMKVTLKTPKNHHMPRKVVIELSVNEFNLLHNAIDSIELDDPDEHDFITLLQEELEVIQCTI